MYEIRKKMEVAGAHILDLPYESKCRDSIHGHNWNITIYVRSRELEHDMVIDFTHLKKQIHDKLDHKTLNNVLDFNPTAENIAKWICEQTEQIRCGIDCYRVDVQESEGNIAIYYKEED